MNCLLKACSSPDAIKASYIKPDGTRKEVPQKAGGGTQIYVLSKDTGFTCENADQIPKTGSTEAEECFDYQVQLCCKGNKVYLSK